MFGLGLCSDQGYVRARVMFGLGLCSGQGYVRVRVIPSHLSGFIPARVRVGGRATFTYLRFHSGSIDSIASLGEGDSMIED